MMSKPCRCPAAMAFMIASVAYPGRRPMRL
jgi:hypothetical protein